MEFCLHRSQVTVWASNTTTPSSTATTATPPGLVTPMVTADLALRLPEYLEAMAEDTDAAFAEDSTSLGPILLLPCYFV